MSDETSANDSPPEPTPPPAPEPETPDPGRIFTHSDDPPGETRILLDDSDNA